MLIKAQLPDNPSYEEACNLVDHKEDSYWLPVIVSICEHHQINFHSSERIQEGANVLFKLGHDLIIKLVPPNWAYQGEAEIAAGAIVSKQLSLAVPQIIAHGKINNWIYVVLQRLPGISLAGVWTDLPFANKKKIIQTIGLFMKELHQIKLPAGSVLKPDWQSYYQELRLDCIPRHTRKKVPVELVSQIEYYLYQHQLDDFSALNDLAEGQPDILIHMDLHPWNLMAELVDEEYQISGVIDFGDAIIGRSQLLEVATPLLFMCQGNAELCAALLESYQLLNCSDPISLQQRLMAVSLLRPACDFNFVLQQVPEAIACKSWEQIAEKLFPF